MICFFFFSSRRRHTRLTCDWSSDVCSSDLRHTAGRHCSFRSILGPRKKELWQKRRRVCLSWRLTGKPRHLNIGLSGVRNASSLTALLLTPNGRVKGWFEEEFQARRCQLFPWRTKSQRSEVRSPTSDARESIRRASRTNGRCACCFLV